MTCLESCSPFGTLHCLLLVFFFLASMANCGGYNMSMYQLSFSIFKIFSVDLQMFPHV